VPNDVWHIKRHLLIYLHKYSLICYAACRDLSSNSGLSGSLPTSIGNLKQLTTLYTLTLRANSYIS
jgi:hypothetical protein